MSKENFVNDTILENILKKLITMNLLNLYLINFNNTIDKETMDVDHKNYDMLNFK